MAAGLGYKEFATGDVLTAADANGYLASQVVMVFASSAARTTAIASPQQGMISFLKDTNTTQYYSGSAWVNLDTTSTGGLTLVKAQTIGSAVSSVNVTSAFSSTYDNYKIIISGGVGSADAGLNLKLGSTTTGYYQFNIVGQYSSGTVTGGNGSNAANFPLAGIATTASISGEFDLQNPNAAKNTHYKAMCAQSNTAGNTFIISGYLANTTQYTDFTLTPASGTLTGGTIRVYGYQNS